MLIELKKKMKKYPILISLQFLLFTSCNNNLENGKVKIFASKNWIGNWSWEKFQAGSNLKIISIQNDSFSFELNGSDGGHTGTIEGQAIVQNQTAIFKQITEFDSCVIKFILINDTTIEVKQLIGQCGCASGVDFSGIYLNENLKIKKDEKSETLVSLKVLDSEQDQILKTLVGEKLYIDYVNSTQIRNLDFEKDIDSLNCEVKAFGVRGLFTIMENIIMIDNSNHIWTAVINSEDDKVYYFTNSENFKDALPKTIEKWREKFLEKEVVFNNK